MKVLIACEFSGRVRDAFRQEGHQAWSCDRLPAEQPSPYHLQQPVETLLTPENRWDLLIAFPPCTDLAVSGAWQWPAKGAERQQAAIAFVQLLLNAPIPRIALENPIGKLSTALRKPDQILQPWHFGDPATKATCLWLKNLPPLLATEIAEAKPNVIRNMAPGPDRAKNRSRTFPGVAQAMARQWGSLPPLNRE